MTNFLRVCLAAAAAAVLMVPGNASAQSQPPATARLLLTVVDPTGGVIPNATVTLVGTEGATRNTTISPVKTADNGQAVVEKLAPGRYTIKAEFQGFAPAELREQRLRAGDNKHVLILPLKRVEDSVTVGRDPREAASDRTLTFGSVLTREQIQALSDDPEEMRRQLQEMGGPDAVIKVDSFEGQQLPPKSQIKSIRISRDQFAAENHASFSSIDIITQPGMGPLRTSIRGNFYDSSLDGRNPLVAARGPGQNRGFGGTIGGTLAREKADFSLSFSGSNNWSTPQLYAATTSGTRAENLAIRTPTVSNLVSGLLNYAVTRDQTIRAGFNFSENDRKNLGVGQFDLIERAYSTESRNWGVRFQESGPLGRRFVTNTRFMLTASRSDTTPFFEAPTTVVQDAFTSGGAQRRGGSETKMFTFQQDLDYVRGIHSVRTGLMLDGGYQRTGTFVNYLGTYTFESLEAYEQGRPRSYSRRLGDPTIELWNVQTAIYVQDDIRPRRNLSISLGMRYEMQTRVQDKVNVAPRAGFTWSPLQSGRMTVRGSFGLFYDWFAPNTFIQMMQTDGTRQSEVNIINPSYPDPGVLEGTSAPTNRYLLEDSRDMPQTRRSSLGISGTIKRLSLGATYSYNRASNILTGENLNAPVNGVRPDATLANVIRAVGRAESVYHSVSGSIGLNLSSTALGLPGAGGSQPFFSLRRGLFTSMFFGLNRSRSNSEGAFSVPATGDLDQEWGRTGAPWNIHANISTSMIRNLSVNLSLGANAGSYYSIRTGRDDNGDTIFNDRPLGVARNTERGTANISSFLSIGYSHGFGRQAAGAGPQGIMIIERGGGVVTAGPAGAASAPRYRLNFGVQIENPTNRANYSGYSGVMTSPFFLKPTSAYGVRRVTFNMGLSF